MSDPLSSWFVHPLVVERFNGTETYEDDFDAAETVTGFYDDRTQYSNGEIVAQGRFAFPRSVAYVPVQSKVTLPAQFGGRVTRVQFVEVGDGGGQPTPDHQVIGLL